MFWGFNDSSPGALVDVLGEFSSREINLTKIESRPRRVRLGHYMFFADLEGHDSDPRVGRPWMRSAAASRRSACWAPTPPGAADRAGWPTHTPRYTASHRDGHVASGSSGIGGW